MQIAGKLLTGDKVLIATGSRPVASNIEGLSNVTVLEDEGLRVLVQAQVLTVRKDGENVVATHLRSGRCHCLRDRRADGDTGRKPG